MARGNARAGAKRDGTAQAKSPKRSAKAGANGAGKAAAKGGAKKGAAENGGVTFTHWDETERLKTVAGEAAAWRLGYDEDPVKPGFMHVRWGPNESAPEHRHKSWTANVVLKGRLKIGEKWYEPGAVALIEPNIWYGPLVAGPEGAELIEIHATIAGLEPIWRDLDDPIVRAMQRWDRETGKGNWH